MREFKVRPDSFRSGREESSCWVLVDHSRFVWKESYKPKRNLPALDLFRRPSILDTNDSVAFADHHDGALVRVEREIRMSRDFNWPVVAGHMVLIEWYASALLVRLSNSCHEYSLPGFKVRSPARATL
jgi:hypothetical protein